MAQPVAAHQAGQHEAEALPGLQADWNAREVPEGSRWDEQTIAGFVHRAAAGE